MPSCDIIMPTYNNAAVLPDTLDALFSQDIPPHWNVQLIASDDGSNDATRALLTQYATNPIWPMKVVHGLHAGSAAARNRALNLSQAGIVFFLGADIVLCPNAVSDHLTFHENYPSQNAAGLGFVVWDPRLNPSPLMEWMIHGGPQNAFDNLLGVSFADPRHYFYAAHLSMKRAMLPHPAFNENFKKYGWEDLELGRRLHRQGLALHVLHRTKALHRHYYTVAAVRSRQVKVGSGLLRYQALHPHEHIFHPGPKYKQILRQLFLAMAGLAILELCTEIANRRNWSLPVLFSRFTSVAFWGGTTKKISNKL